MIPLNKVNRLVFMAAFAAVLAPLSASASSTVTIDAGFLRQNALTALNSTTGGGALLLLVAAGGNGGTTFTNILQAGQYVAGGDVVLATLNLSLQPTTLGFNTNGGTGGTGGETINTFVLPTSDLSLASAGTYVELRWFPSITVAQYNSGATPAAGSVFGAYNPKVVVPTQSLNPDGDQQWVVPSDGSTAKLDFFTADDQGGSQLTPTGYANFPVVPEPSTYAMLGCAAVGFLGMNAYRRRRAV